MHFWAATGHRIGIEPNASNGRGAELCTRRVPNIDCGFPKLEAPEERFEHVQSHYTMQPSEAKRFEPETGCSLRMRVGHFLYISL